MRNVCRKSGDLLNLRDGWEHPCEQGIDQIRTIDQSRITKTIGNLDDETIEKVKAVIKEAFVD